MKIQNYDPKREEPQFGIILNEPDDIYHSVPAISNSKLSVFRKRSYQYYRKFISKETPPEEKERSNLLVGRASHCWLLEGEDAFVNRFTWVSEDAPSRPLKRREEYKGKIQPATEEKLQYWEKFYKSAVGKTILEWDEYCQVCRIIESAQRNAILVEILKEIQPEVTFRVNLGWKYCRHPWMQCRVDGWIESMSAHLAEILSHLTNRLFFKGDSMALDLKTAYTLTEEDFGSFQKSYASHEYFIQDALYREVISSVRKERLNHFLWAAVEKVEPYETMVFCTSDEDLELAYEMLKLDLEKLKRCHTTKNWHSYDQEKIFQLGIPDWSRRRAENILQAEKSV